MLVIFMVISNHYLHLNPDEMAQDILFHIMRSSAVFFSGTNLIISYKYDSTLNIRDIVKSVEISPEITDIFLIAR